MTPTSDLSAEVTDPTPERGTPLRRPQRRSRCAARSVTRFLATPESGEHPDYVAALLAAGAEDTVPTTTFSVGWSDAPHRVLASAASFDREAVGTLDVNGESQPLPRFAARTPSREVGGAIEAMALYAGGGVGQVTETRDAESLVRELSAGAETLLRRWAPDRSP